MGKYLDLFTNIYSVFGTPAWTAENIKTIPANYTGEVNNADYIRVSVIPSSDGINLASISGILIIDIFVRFGLGPGAVSSIADSLDEYLVGKTLTTENSTQFRNSSLALLGMDLDNNSLFRAKYVIPFNHFGV